MNYIIEYQIITTDNNIYTRKTRVKNRKDTFDAQISLEKYLKKKNNNFDKLVVITCKEDHSIESLFGNMFGSSNPFNFKSDNPFNFK